jgi:hypothetical protein
MNYFTMRGKIILFSLVLLVGPATTAQAVTLACGRGVLFDREFAIPGHTHTTDRHERHWTIFRFTNPSKTLPATISQIVFVDPDGTPGPILGDGEDPFPADFNPVIEPRAQADLDMRDVFTGTPPLVPGEARILKRLVATADRKLVGRQIRVTFGFEPPGTTYGLQEERGRVILDCEEK